MKAIAIKPGTRRVDIVEFEEPQVTSPTHVKVKVLEVGICGTDRNEVTEGKVRTPRGVDEMIIGHEMFGQVVAIGDAVTTVQVGDYAVFSVRRGCGKCLPCLFNRSDMCYTGAYTERGIKESHGFDAEFVVDDEQYLVKVPESILSVGVLAEPMSISEKAIDEALLIQAARLAGISSQSKLKEKRVLVAGLGAVGILACMALRLREAEVIGLDIVDENSAKPHILKKIGGMYLDGRTVGIADLNEKIGQVDFIFEATGVARISFNLIDALGVNGIYVMTGIAHDTRPVSVAGDLMNQIVLKNQIILGSVNAGPKHFQYAVEDLELARHKWGTVIDEVITRRIDYHQFEEAIKQQSDNDIKTVIQWGRPINTDNNIEQL